MRVKNSNQSEIAVSEVVGFIIILGIMMTGIGLVTLYGYPALIQEQANANIKNMERNMIVLQNDIESLTYKSVPYEETSMQVSGGTLLVQKDPGVGAGLQSNFVIDVYGDGSTVRSFSPGEVVYNSQDGMATISLENGAVHVRYWGSPTGSAMLAEPRWFYDESTHTFVMPFITINASDYLSQTGIGTVQMKILETTQTPPYDVTGSTVKVVYNADNENNYNTAWKNYFNSNSLKMSFMPGESDGFKSTFTLDPNVKTLVIKTYNVTILSL